MRLVVNILFLIASLLPLQLSAATDSIRRVFPDSSTFVGRRFGEDSLNVFVGRLSDKKFNQSWGYFEIIGSNKTPLYILSVNGASDSCFINCNVLESSYIYERFTDEHFQYFGVIGAKAPKFLKGKFYNYQEKKWYIQTKTDDYTWGHRYDSEFDHLEDLNDDDTIMWYLAFTLLLGIAMWAMLRPFTGGLKWQLSERVALIGSIVCMVAVLVIVDKWTQLQLVLPLVSFLIVLIASHYYKKESLQLAFMHLIICLSLVLGWGYYQFFLLDDHATLADGTEVRIHWRPGTDLPKRCVIKRLFRNMVPVPVADRDSSTVYADKYEFTEGELAMLNDDCFGWMTYLLHDDVAEGLSFREAQIVLQMIENLCGVRLDFFTFPEWQSASLGQSHAKHDSELRNADDGEPNKYGLINIASNAPEFTSSYYPTIKLGLHADTLVRAVNNVYVCGNAYVSGHEVNYTVVNKNIREGSVGLRLVYRPKGIDTKFYVKGTKINDGQHNDYPSTIYLVSIDNRVITSFSNFESFEEYLIEHLHEAKQIEAMDAQTLGVTKLTVPAGLGIYDFVPVFNFKGRIDDSAIIGL